MTSLSQTRRRLVTERCCVEPRTRRAQQRNAKPAQFIGVFAATTTQSSAHVECDDAFGHTRMVPKNLYNVDNRNGAICDSPATPTGMPN